MNKAKKKHNKRELLENDKYTRHAKAQPYVRDNQAPIKELANEDKQEMLNFLLGDWDANSQ